MFFRRHLLSLGTYGLILFGILMGVNCSEPQQIEAGKCRFDSQCASEERCVYPKETCWEQLGSCEGICKKPDTTKKKCECQKDKDCPKYPFFRCANCQCTDQSHTIIQCDKDGKCSQGYYCIKGEKVNVCEPRKSCNKEKDCRPGYKCVEKTCCNPTTKSCPSECIVGKACKIDDDCASCQMICKNGMCESKASTGQCLGKMCITNLDCSDCNAVCQQGKCQNTGKTCNTVRCFTDSDCKGSGLSSCLVGCCQ